MGDPVREIQVFEDAYERDYLGSNNLYFNIAKSVTTGDGSTTFNTIWQSKGIAPNISIQWNAVYALNWTAEAPSVGASVTLAGEWQLCNKGQSFDIDPNGGWIPSATAPVPGFLCVGSVNYKFPDVDGIHIVVGVQNKAGGYDRIFVDKTALAPFFSAQYQPVETVTWWYQEGQRTGTMISTVSSDMASVDLTAPNPSTHKYYYSTSYKHDTGVWVILATPPTAAMTAPYVSELVPAITAAGNIGKAPIMVDVWPAVRKIIFSAHVDSQKNQATIKGRMEKSFSFKYKEVEVKWASVSELGMTLTGWKDSPPTYSVQAIGPAKDDIDADINDVLKNSADVLPRHEHWTIQDVPS